MLSTSEIEPQPTFTVKEAETLWCFLWTHFVDMSIALTPKGQDETVTIQMSSAVIQIQGHMLRRLFDAFKAQTADSLSIDSSPLPDSPFIRTIAVRKPER